MFMAGACLAQGTVASAAPVGDNRTIVLIPLNHANPALIAELLGGVVIYDTGPGMAGAPLGRRARSAPQYGVHGLPATGHLRGPAYGGYTGLGHGFSPHTAERWSTGRTTPGARRGVR